MNLTGLMVLSGGAGITTSKTIGASGEWGHTMTRYAAPVFQKPFMHKSCCQGRLGANIRKTQTTDRFLTGVSRREVRVCCAARSWRGDLGAKTPLCVPLIYKNRTFYQDRLGTNIDKALKKERRCSQAIDYPFGDEEEWTALQRMQVI